MSANSTPRVSSPPSGIMRFLFRLPVYLYRLGLGWVLGGRFVLLHHVGRKSGKVYDTVVEVVSYDRETDVYHIVSGYGYKADWYRNLKATPDISIQVGRRKTAAHVEFLSPESARDLLVTYREEHPGAARELSNFMGIDILTTSTDDLLEITTHHLPMMALHPAKE